MVFGHIPSSIKGSSAEDSVARPDPQQLIRAA
jgi:hypothetical protein